MLQLESLAPPPLVGAEQIGFRLFSQGQTPRRVASADGRLITAGRELLQAELPYGLEHQVARFGAPLLQAEQVRVDERGDALQRLELMIGGGVGDRQGSGEGAATAEDGQLLKQDLLRLRQQVVAPGDGVAHRLLPGRGVSAAGSQQRESVLQAR